MSRHGVILVTSLLTSLLSSLFLWLDKWQVFSAVLCFICTLLMASHVLDLLLTRGTSGPRLLASGWLVSTLEFLVNVYKALVGEEKDESGEHAFCGKEAEVDNEIDTFVEAISRDYIDFWYKTISPENGDFPEDCESSFRGMFRKLLKNYLLNLDHHKFCVKLLDHILNHLKNENSSVEEETRTLIRENEEEMVSALVEDLLLLCGPREVKCLREYQGSAANGDTKDALYVMVRELLTNGVFIPIIGLISEPKWIYKNVSEFMNNQIKDISLTSSPSIAEVVPVAESPSSCRRSQSFVATSKALRNVRQTMMNNYHCMLSTSDIDCSKLLPASPLVSRKFIRRSRSHGTDVCVTPDAKYCVNQRLIAPEEDLISNGEDALEVGVEANFSELYDTRLFINVKIPETELTTCGNETFIVYCIEYDALFEEIEPETGGQSVDSCLIRKRVSLKRRFREFVTLQNRLEENPRLKKHIRKIKKPSKLRLTTQTFFGTKIEPALVEYRKVFLELYLTDLCYKQPIAESVELQQFLGYGSDARLAYVKAKHSHGVPLRIDRAIFKGFKGAMSLIKIALPTDFSQEGIPSVSASLKLFKSNKTTLRNDLDFRFGPLMEIEKALDLIDVTIACVNDDTVIAEPGTEVFATEFEDALGPRVRGDGCDDEQEQEGPKHCQRTLPSGHLCPEFTREIPLANPAIDLAHFVTSSGFSSNSIKSVIFKVVFGQIIERFVSKMVTKGATNENAVYFLHLLHESIWSPKSEINERDDYSASDALHAVEAYLRMKAPFYRLLSHKLNRAVNVILRNVQFQERNKLFIYQLLNTTLKEIKSL